MNQKVELSYQVELEDHILNFRKEITCQIVYVVLKILILAKFKWMDVMKLNLGFQSNMILGSNR